MTKYIKNSVLFWLVACYLSILFIFPLQLFMFGYYSTIFPAFDLVWIYYFSTYRKIEIWQLIIIGLLIDLFYGLQTGTNSLILIIGYFFLKRLAKLVLLKEYITNLLVFAVYIFLIMISRYFVAGMYDSSELGNYNIYFYFLTTILAYPVLKVLIHKPLELLRWHAR